MCCVVLCEECGREELWCSHASLLPHSSDMKQGNYLLK